MKLEDGDLKFEVLEACSLKLGAQSLDPKPSKLVVVAKLLILAMKLEAGSLKLAEI